MFSYNLNLSETILLIRSVQNLLYTWIFSPCVISTLLHLLTILPFLKYAQTQLRFKRDHLRLWNLPADNHGKKGGEKNGGKYFPVYSTSGILVSVDKTKTSHCVQICVFTSMQCLIFKNVFIITTILTTINFYTYLINKFQRR